MSTRLTWGAILLKCRFLGGYVDKFRFLNHFLETMELRGEVASLVFINVNTEFVTDFNKRYKTKHTLEEFVKLVDVCKAHEWVKCTAGGRGPHGNLVITSKGVAAIRSKNESDRRKSERSAIKKLSDCIEDHKGLFVVFGFIIALATFYLKINGTK